MARGVGRRDGRLRLAGRVLGQHGVAAELLAQRGDGAHGDALLVLAHEAGVERGADHRRGDAALDRLLHGPATLAGVLGDRRQAVEAGALLEGAHEQVEQPRAHHAPLPPGRQRALGVDVEPGAGEQLVALGVGLHQPVLDAVVHHLREVAGAGRAGVDEAALGRQRVEHRLRERRRARPRRRP